MTIRVGIIGAGHWHARRHVAALMDYGVEIVGVSDPNPEVSRRTVERIGGLAFDNHRDLLHGLALDFVLAMPPHDEAAAVTLEIIHRRLPALVEKPGGLRGSDIAPLAKRAREEQLYIAVPFVNRYSALADRADRSTDEPVHGAFRIINGPPTRYADAGCAWMLDPARSGGGALRNLGIHAADAALTLVASQSDHYTLAGCNLSFVDGFDVEVHGQALVTFSSGATALIEAGYTYPMVSAGMTHGGDYEWRLATRSGYLRERDELVRIARVSGETEEPVMPDAERYRRFVHDTMDRWKAGEPPVADLDDCRRAAELIDRIYDAAGVPWAVVSTTTETAV